MPVEILTCKNWMKSAASVVFGDDQDRSLDSAKKLVALGFPTGASFSCGWCNRIESADVADLAGAITGSWPHCHGARMQIQDADDSLADTQAQTVFRITLKALPGPAPDVVRLRRLLKLALRGFAFRCVDIEEL